MYACCGATDYYLETGDPVYWKTLNALWEDLVATKCMLLAEWEHVDGRGFRRCLRIAQCACLRGELRRYRQHDVELAHAGRVWRSTVSDVMECALYNGINSGMSLDGKTYCYRNPLAFDPTGDSETGTWFRADP